MNKVNLCCCVLHCIGVEFILCKGKRVSVIQYKIVDDKCKLKQKQSFDFQTKDFYYDGECGICVFNSLSLNDESDLFMSNEVISNNDNLCDMNSNQDKKYSIILFGRDSFEGYDVGDGNFASSLQWLSLNIANNNNHHNSYSISIDHEKTKQFQNTFVDKDILGRDGYCSFGYTKWKRYLILFGGRVSQQHDFVDSIFYFDLVGMKWYKSLQVL